MRAAYITPWYAPWQNIFDGDDQQLVMRRRLASI